MRYATLIFGNTLYAKPRDIYEIFTNIENPKEYYVLIRMGKYMI